MISIVTATYNNLEITKAYWESLKDHPPPGAWEIIWIDDGSTDGTREWLKSIESENCRVILNSDNQGFAVNNNLAAQHARGETLCLLNNDLCLKQGWFKPMLDALLRSKKNGIIGNVQLQASTERIDHAGILFDLAGLPTHAKKGELLKALRGHGAFHSAVTGACWLIRRDLFIGAGGFDTIFRNGFEDVDLCLRLGKKGYRHWVCYDSVILHHVSASEGRLTNNSQNVENFIKRWADYTSLIGQAEWPRHYLSRVINNPSKIDVKKFADALLRLLKLRSGDSKWAARKRAELSHD